MKKIFLLVLMMILCMVCMCACSNNSESQVKESSENTGAVESADINEQDDESFSDSGEVVNAVIDNSNSSNNQANNKKSCGSLFFSNRNY